MNTRTTSRFLSVAVALGGVVAGAMYVDRLRRQHACRFEGKAVVITGGSRGLGLILARMLVDEGARVTLISRDEAELERAQRDLERQGAQRVLTIPADVRDKTSIQAAIRAAAESLGGLDVLINSAGIIGVGPLQHMNVRDFEDAMATHFWGALYAIEAALPIMRKQGEGRILNIASIGGKIALPHLGPYSASKAALVSLSETMRAELAMENITVTVACPGPMRTGSHVNVLYKGRHNDEFGGFSLMASLPLISTDARVAARLMIEGCRRGDAAVIIPSLFRLLPAVNNLVPNLVAGVMAIVNRFEPPPTSAEGDEAREGWECSSALSPSVLTVMGDQATVDNNGLRGHPAPPNARAAPGSPAWPDVSVNTGERGDHYTSALPSHLTDPTFEHITGPIDPQSASEDGR